MTAACPGAAGARLLYPANLAIKASAAGDRVTVLFPRKHMGAIIQLAV